MLRKMQIDVATVTFRSLRLLLPLAIWSCHAWVAPAFRLYHGLAAELHPQEGILNPKFLNPDPGSQNQSGTAKRAEMNGHMMNSFQHLVCHFTAFNRRGLNNKTSPPRINQPLNPSGFTLIELIVAMVIVGILAATLLPRIDFSSTSSTASVNGAAYMVASDIRYAQEWAMANRTSKQINFTQNSSTYTFTPASNLDPSGQLQGAAIGTTITFTFNSLGEPTAGGGSSVTVSAGGITRTIAVTRYTGKATIS